MNLTLRQIRYFIAIAEAASASSAARDLSISQSATTTAMRDLERGLGVTLLERSSSGVTSLVAGYYLAELLDRYRRAFPEVEIAVSEDEHGFLEHMPINGEVDVAILMLNTLHEHNALGAEVLIRSPNRLWLAADHPLCEATEVSLRDIAQVPQITLVADGIDEVMAARSGAAAGLRNRACCAPARSKPCAASWRPASVSRCCRISPTAPGRWSGTESSRAPSATSSRPSTSAWSGAEART